MRIFLLLTLVIAAGCVGSKTTPSEDAAPAPPSSSVTFPSLPMRPLTRMPTLRYQPPGDGGALPAPGTP
ncbi:MAG: hypothetical protein HY898_24355 [Deltaproteobacteria bacterium]|nr:hypothetical protein [Deltaproteobacteria bacterium]